MLRTPFASERIQRIDPTTGIKVIQLTSYPSPAAHVPYDWPSITPDNSRIILYAQRWTGRTAPWDIYRVDSDGLNMFQLTEDGEDDSAEGYYGRQWCALTLDGQTLYVLWNRILRRIDVETGKDEAICDLSEHSSEQIVLGRIGISSTGNRLFISRRGKPQEGQHIWQTPPALRYELATGSVDEVDFQSEPRVMVQRVSAGDTVRPEVGADGIRRFVNVGGLPYLYSVDEDGGSEKLITQNIFAHCTLLGRSDAVQGCGRPPERCLWTAKAGEEPEKLVQGPYFWHSAGSMDGEWVVADTNWPDCGIQLAHVPTKQFRTLCHPNGSLAHVEFGHPHPCISQDGRLVVFRSDRTGMSQVYAAHVTDEFRESVIAGELDRPNDKWM